MSSSDPPAWSWRYRVCGDLDYPLALLKAEPVRVDGDPGRLLRLVPLCRLQRDLLENRALPLRDRVGRHGASRFLMELEPGSSSRYTWPSRSRMRSGCREAPRHGPATQSPVLGSNNAP